MRSRVTNISTSTISTTSMGSNSQQWLGIKKRQSAPATMLLRFLAPATKASKQRRSASFQVTDGDSTPTLLLQREAQFLHSEEGQRLQQQSVERYGTVNWGMRSFRRSLERCLRNPSVETMIRPCILSLEHGDARYLFHHSCC